MTGRERLNRRKRWMSLGVMGGLGLIFGGMGLIPLLAGEGVGGPAVAAVVAPGVVVLLAAVAAGQQFLFRCPWCRGNLGPLVTNSFGWRVSPKVRFCPYCGTDLNDPVDAAADWDAPVD